MKDLKEASRLAVEVVSRERGQCKRDKLVRLMIIELGNDGNSALAEDGIGWAIDDGYLFDNGDVLVVI